MQEIIIFLLFQMLAGVCKSLQNENGDFIKPTFLEEPFILLMFNGSSDLKNYAIMSQYREKHGGKLKYDGVWKIEVTKNTPFTNDYSLIMNGEKAYSAITFRFLRPFRFESSCLIVQYDTRFPNGHDCGGAYIKLLPQSEDNNLTQFSNLTPYTIMFGPDKCGLDFEIKFLFQYEDQITKEYRERKFQPRDKKKERKFLGDNITHVYTLVLCENNMVQIFKDLRLVKEGNLLLDFNPPVVGDRYVVDEKDIKPKDWDDREYIADPYSIKPDDWDDNAEEFILDKDAVKPKSWLENEPLMIRSTQDQPKNWDEKNDGKWIPPLIKNVRCKINGCGPWTPPRIRNFQYQGKWEPPFINNPKYKGEWIPRMVENPLFKSNFNVYRKLRPISTLGIEILSQTPGIYFDNFLITDNFTSAKEFAMHTWWPKYKVDTADMPHYQDIFNKTQLVKKPKLSSYMHWFWALIPLILGTPFLAFITYLIRKKSCRQPDLTREKYILCMYEMMKKNVELYSESSTVQGSDDNLYSKEILNEISDHSISQQHKKNDKINEDIRKRMLHKMQSPRGDIL